MTIKLHNLSKWRELPDENSLMLRSNVLRKIKLNVNTEAPASFVAFEAGVEYFLGVANGLETFEFSAAGDIEVSATCEGMVWYWTDDGDDHSHSLGDHKLFVMPMTRETRSPEMDALAAKIQARADRRFAIQEENNQALWAQLARERAERNAAAAQEPVDDPEPAGEPDAGEEGAS